MVALAGGSSIRCAEYATFGTEALSVHTLAALDGRRACLLANHGAVALGADLELALGLLSEVERVAEVYALALAAGVPVTLDAEETARVVERFREYLG
jgi:L-fuculose-phosphate aldolase